MFFSITNIFFLFLVYIILYLAIIKNLNNNYYWCKILGLVITFSKRFLLSFFMRLELPIFFLNPEVCWAQFFFNFSLAFGVIYGVSAGWYSELGPLISTHVTDDGYYYFYEKGFSFQSETKPSFTFHSSQTFEFDLASRFRHAAALDPEGFKEKWRIHKLLHPGKGTDIKDFTIFLNNNPMYKSTFDCLFLNKK